MVRDVAIILCGYLLGSIPFSYLVAKGLQGDATRLKLAEQMIENGERPLDAIDMN